MFLHYLVEKREGDDIDEALANIQEAIELYIEPTDDDFSSLEGAQPDIKFIIRE